MRRITKVIYGCFIKFKGFGAVLLKMVANCQLCNVKAKCDWVLTSRKDNLVSGI